MLANGYGFDGWSGGAPRSGVKGGGLWGLSAEASYTEGGTSYVVIFNQEGILDSAAVRAAVRGAVTGATWPATGDLFPSVGLLALP
jgi:hypothetical protein